jgi:signal transduction histidine kinase
VFLDLYASRKRLSDEVAAHERTLSALQHANGSLRHFTDAASHDLKAPLRAIRGFLEAVVEEHGEQLPKEASEYVTRSLKASERMDSLLTSLLDYARLQRTLTFEPTATATIVAQVIADLDEQIARVGASLVVGELPTVRGDPSRLYQLFLNLVGNALKFRRDEQAPRIVVGAATHDDDWVFRVEDNGIGIDSKYASVVFTAFRRLHSASKYEGSGLGLAICQQIVEQHGGRIWVESSLGGGSCFYFTLRPLE